MIKAPSRVVAIMTAATAMRTTVAAATKANTSRASMAMKKVKLLGEEASSDPFPYLGYPDGKKQEPVKLKMGKITKRSRRGRK